MKVCYGIEIIIDLKFESIGFVYVKNICDLV